MRTFYKLWQLKEGCIKRCLSSLTDALKNNDLLIFIMLWNDVVVVDKFIIQQRQI